MTASTPLPLSGSRDPSHLLDRTLAEWGERGDVWIFGYASLIWRPEFAAAEERPAKVHGWHRSLAMRSRINRGTPECPGLVFALIPGGSCQGRAYRIEQARVETELRRLWGREMPSGVYDPKWLGVPDAAGAPSAHSRSRSAGAARTTPVFPTTAS
jgi:cation transport protein ChaC